MRPPRLALKRVLELRDKTFSRAFEGFIGLTLQGSELLEAARLAARVLQAPLDPVYESVRPLTGGAVTREAALATAWRLAGNYQQLRAGRPALPWVRQAADEWTAVQVLKAVPVHRPGKRPGCDYTFRVLLGTACPLLIRAYWPSAVSSLAARRVGFTKRAGAYPYHGPVELVGLRVVVKLSQERSHQQPVFYEVADEQPGWLLKWNRDNVLRMRSRKIPCPRGYSHACRDCVIGYEECPAGTHQKTFIARPCGDCGNAQALFDPGLSQQTCAACFLRSQA